MPFCLPFCLQYYCPVNLLLKFYFLLQFIFPQVAAAHPSAVPSALHLPFLFCLLPWLVAMVCVAGPFVLVFEDSWRKRGERVAACQ